MPNVGIGTTSPQAGLDVAITGTLSSALIVPRDTTANRPSTPVNGMIRYATDTNMLESYQNSAWQAVASGIGTVMIDADTYVTPGGSGFPLAASINIGGASAQVGYIFFDTSIFPVGSTVRGAYLNLFVSGISTGGAINVYPCTSSWTEAGLTGSNMPTTGSLAGSATATTINKIVKIDITSTVNAWLSGSLANNGLALMATGTTYSINFKSKEGSSTGIMPMLTTW